MDAVLSIDTTKCNRIVARASPLKMHQSKGREGNGGENPKTQIK